MANTMSEPAQHKAALTGPHVRLVAGIGLIVLITAVFLYIFAKNKQNAAGSDTSAGTLGSGQSGSAWDSLTYNLNYTPASSGSTNNPGAPGTPATSPSTPSAPAPTSGTKTPTSGGTHKVVKKKTTAPAHTGSHASPTHPAKTGSGGSSAATSKSSYTPTAEKLTVKPAKSGGVVGSALGAAGSTAGENFQSWGNALGNVGSFLFGS